MENYESKIIFSQKFPDARPMAMLEKAEELCHAAPACGEILPPPFADVLRHFNEKYTFEPKPDAAEKSENFISKAIAVCRDFEIDTEISQRKYEIAVSMDIYYGWYGGPVKHALETLLVLADDFSLTCDKSKPDCFCISMAYHTHEMRSYGERVEWW